LSLLTFLLIFSWLFVGGPGIEEAYAAAPAVESFSVSVSSGNVGSIYPAMPSGTVEGDLLVAIMSTDGGGETLTAPGDWTMITSGVGTGHTSRSWYKIAGASETGPYTFLVGSNETIVIGILRISGTLQSDPIDFTPTPSTGTSATPTSPSEITTVADTLILRYFGADDDDITQDSGYPSPHTGVYVRGSLNGSNETSSGVAYTTQAAAGPTGTAAFSLNASEEWSAVTIAVKPAAEISSSGNQVFAIGQGATTISQITITETSTSTITDTNNLRIRIVDGVNMVWDTSASPTYGGTYPGNVTSTSYEDSDRVLVIDVDTDFAPSETFTIDDLAFKTFGSVNSPVSGLQLFLGGPSDTGVDAADDKTITIKGAVTLADHALGQVSDKFTPVG
jgi:hypothetical protein